MRRESIVSREDMDGMHILTVREPRSFFGQDWNGGESGLVRGMYGQDGKLKAVLKLICEGKSNPVITRLTGVSRNTIRRARKIAMLLKLPTVACPCDLPVTHRGTCWHRLKNSARRLSYVQKVREKLALRIQWHTGKISELRSKLESLKDYRSYDRTLERAGSRTGMPKNNSC